MRPASIIMAMSLVVVPATVRAQQAAADTSEFVTGACPAQPEAKLDWDAIVTEPTRLPRLRATSLPHSPAHLMTEGYSGRIVLGFAIDAGGRVVPGTVSVTSSTDPRLSAWACTAFLGLRFDPAEKDGRPVATLTEQPFAYERLRNVAPSEPLGPL